MDIREKLVELMLECDRAFNVFAHYKSTKSSIIADYLIEQGVAVQEWIPVTERLPEPETEVWILAKCGNRHIITNGMYEDGSNTTEDSTWWWTETDGFEYDEENDTYLIPEGWWEYKHYNGDDEYNHAIDDPVTHWMPLPSAPKGA